MPAYQLRIARTGGAGRYQEYRVNLEERMTVLDALFVVQREQDATLSFRCSCRVGMCGSCALTVNWQPRLACQTRVATLKSDTLTVEPLSTLPVVKDLVVSMEPFFAQWKKIRPALHPKSISREL